MSQPLHHSFILRPAPRAPMTTSYVVMQQQQQDNTRRRQIIPPEPPRPHLTLLRNKTLTSPPHWSRRRQCPKPTQLLDKFNHDDLPRDFMPPTSPTYWKERCQRFQQLCQSSRKRIRDMEEDQRQLRRRIHYLEERLTFTDQAKTRSVTPIPSTIVTTPQPRECFYMADCEGMSDSEYGEHYYCTFDEEEEDDDEEEVKVEPKAEDPVIIKGKEEQPAKKEEAKKETVEIKDKKEEKKDTPQAEIVEQRDDTE